MNFVDNRVENLKIAYIGGGSRGWAWGLMSDLARAEDMSGEVFLYDIDLEAARANEIIGNRIRDLPECRSAWKYSAVSAIDEALTGADFVVISILPGTFDEMQSDVHTPEKYGIYQSVGDTAGPGGVLRALRTVPMMEVIARAIQRCCPTAWVINYTNPMTVCIRTLYAAFPGIKAFGCCHEVFGTQTILQKALADIRGIENARRDEIKVNVVGVNHFTWFTSAQYRGTDLFPVYREFVEKYREAGFIKDPENHWMNSSFESAQIVKMNLFNRFGYIAAAGDRHLAEFCPGDWYLRDPEQVKSWKFGLTTVAWRKNDLQARLEKSRKLVSGEIPFTIDETGEEGVHQMRALLGLCDLVSNVNIPNVGQIPNLPLGHVVETNAAFRANSLTPLMAGPVPDAILPLIARASAQQELVAKAARERDLELAFAAFAADPLVRIPTGETRRLFAEMVENTRHYLTEYGM